MKNRASRHALRRFFQYFYLGFIYLFLLGPMMIVIIASFNSAYTFPSPFKSFTLDWYRAVFEHAEFIKAIWVSTRVALIASALATLMGVPLAIMLVRTRFKLKETLNAFFMTPLIIPQVALSIALLQMFSLLKLQLSDWALIFAHTVFIVPYIIRATIASLHFVNRETEEAGMNLGANRLQTFFLITLPAIRGGITSGFILAFVISFINVPLSLFLSTPATTTLPIRVFAHMESRLDPLVAAIGALIVFAVTIVVLFLEKVLKIRLVL